MNMERNEFSKLADCSDVVNNHMGLVMSEREIKWETVHKPTIKKIVNGTYKPRNNFDKKIAEIMQKHIANRKQILGA